MPDATVEERLAAVETELSQLKRQIKADRAGTTDAPWWNQWFGAFKDNPDFVSAMERGAAYRRSQPKSDE